MSIIYLANSDGGNSLMCRYNTGSLGDGAPPNSVENVTDPGQDIIWEGQPITTGIADGSGFPFTTHVEADAGSRQVDEPAGIAREAIFAVAPPGSPPGSKAYNLWNIFKHDGRVLYTDPVLGNVHSIYYCLNVSCFLSHAARSFAWYSWLTLDSWPIDASGGLLH